MHAGISPSINTKQSDENRTNFDSKTVHRIYREELDLNSITSFTFSSLATRRLSPPGRQEAFLLLHHALREVREAHVIQRAIQQQWFARDWLEMRRKLHELPLLSIGVFVAHEGNVLVLVVDK